MIEEATIRLLPWLPKRCPHCGGKLILEYDPIFGTVEHCIFCGRDNKESVEVKGKRQYNRKQNEVSND